MFVSIRDYTSLSDYASDLSRRADIHFRVHQIQPQIWPAAGCGGDELGLGVVSHLVRSHPVGVVLHTRIVSDVRGSVIGDIFREEMDTLRARASAREADLPNGGKSDSVMLPTGAVEFSCRFIAHASAGEDNSLTNKAKFAFWAKSLRHAICDNQLSAVFYRDLECGGWIAPWLCILRVSDGKRERLHEALADSVPGIDEMRSVTR